MRVQKKELLQFIRSRDLVTFPEIEEFFKAKGYDYKGGTSIRLQDNTVLWFGWTHRALRQFMELYNDGKIFLYQSEDAPPPPPIRPARTSGRRSPETWPYIGPVPPGTARGCPPW